MNWFNLQSKPDLTKLWGRIDYDLDKGSYILTVQNSNYYLLKNIKKIK
jgi:hypothetical protein